MEKKLAININSKKDLGLIYINLGATLEKLEENAMRLTIHLKAAAIFEELEDELNYSISRFNYLIVASKIYGEKPRKINKSVHFVNEYKELVPVFEKYKISKQCIFI